MVSDGQISRSTLNAPIYKDSCCDFTAGLGPEVGSFWLRGKDFDLLDVQVVTDGKLKS